MNLKMDTKAVNGVSVVHCSGRIVVVDEGSVLGTKVEEILSTRKKIVLVLSQLTRIDGGRVGTLVLCSATARSSGADIKLARRGQRVRHVLQITRLVTVFEVYAAEQKALAA